MREHYDFSKAKRNPYARRLGQQVTIRLDHDTVKYRTSPPGPSPVRGERNHDQIQCSS
jgi:hypothetical protein